MLAATKDAYKLMHDGALALSRVEAAGIRVDVQKLEETIELTKASIEEKERELKADNIYKFWRRRFKDRTNLESRQQLQKVLVLDAKIALPEGIANMDVDVLGKIDDPFIKIYAKYVKEKKLLGTYLLGVQKHIAPDGFLHPSFPLSFVRTYRGSSQDPNFQNIPIRDKYIGKLIRSCFIARDGHQLLENDFKGAEVNIAACYHRDPTMLKYLAEDYDLHKTMAAECFMVPLERVSKPMRQATKGMFVFAQFYGDWYASCARNLWSIATREDLKTAYDESVLEVLADNGVNECGDPANDSDPKPGTFVYHLKEVEEAFWNERFPIYTQWKKDWFEAYQRAGYFQMFTGFICSGVYNKKEVINYPIQGSSFHCLLWCLTKLVKQLHKYKMKSVVVAQIHDSMISDVAIDELDNVLDMVYQIVEKDLPKAWDWIVTGMKVEAELCPIGGSWFDKQEYKR